MDEPVPEVDYDDGVAEETPISVREFTRAVALRPWIPFRTDFDDASAPMPHQCNVNEELAAGSPRVNRPRSRARRARACCSRAFESRPPLSQLEALHSMLINRVVMYAYRRIRHL